MESAPGLVPVSATSSLQAGSPSASRPFDHHYEEYPTLVATINPSHAPAIDSIAPGDWLEQAQELSICWQTMYSAGGGIVKAGDSAAELRRNRLAR